MHNHEAVLRRAYDAFKGGDMPGFLALCTPDITFRVPGQGLLAGQHTLQGFLEKLGPAMQAVGGTFREEVISVALGADGTAAVLAAQQAERDGKAHRWNAVHWWRFRDGNLCAFHELIDDPEAFERAWHR